MEAMETTPLLEWRTEKRRVADLVPFAYNPRKISPEKRASLERSLKEFNLVEIPVVNLDNTLLAGHQRVGVLISVGRGEEEIDTRVPNRMLSEREVKRYNVLSNANFGEFVDKLLQQHFADVELEDFGFDFASMDAALAAAKTEAGETEEEEPEYPITAKFSEKYEAVVILIPNEIDANHIREILGLGIERDYKASTNVGRTHVLTAAKFLERWKCR